jgi:uncharacterized protein (UPF0332 family)
MEALYLYGSQARGDALPTSDIDAAEMLLQQDFPDFAASPAYDAMFYIAQAFLIERTLTFSSHSAVIATFAAGTGCRNQWHQQQLAP